MLLQTCSGHNKNTKEYLVDIIGGGGTDKTSFNSGGESWLSAENEEVFH